VGAEVGSATSTGTTTTSYPNGVARVDVTTHRDLHRSLVEAGLDEPTADADIKALHQGRVLVLVHGDSLSPADLATALDGPPQRLASDAKNAKSPGENTRSMARNAPA
jgi:hypothetical protein